MASAVAAGIVLALDPGEEAEVQRGRDLDGFQGQGGRVKRKGDWVDHFRVH